MAKIESKDSERKRDISRRDFLKMSAAGAAAGVGATMLDWTLVKPNPAVAAEITKTSISTCPYCSVGCNMVVGVDADDKVVDIWGDPDCPINNGKLCSKGAAAIQLVNNNRRVGVSDSIHTASRTYGPMKRTGDNAWQAITWADAIDEIGDAMLAARSNTTNWISDGKVIGQAQGVAFLGCSHATNEENWIYRKMIANFGTNNIEHQARI